MEKSFPLPELALESTVLSHGLPWPENLALSEDLDRICAQEGVNGLTFGFLQGELKRGLSPAEINHFCSPSSVIEKVSMRDIPGVIANKKDGATTVASTIWAAHKSGLPVMATGGIGGIHLDEKGGASWDESADLHQLATTPVTVVCSGPKAILHLEATRERLETLGVCVVGYKTDLMAAFFCGASSLGVDVRCDSVAEIVALIAARDSVGLPGALLVVQPVDPAFEIPLFEVQQLVKSALASKEAATLKPNQITPFLLDQVRKQMGNKALIANIELLKANTRLAAQICADLAS